VADDPVTRLQQVLKTTGQSASERDRSLKQAIAVLHTLQDLRRALALPEWSCNDCDPNWAGVDEANLAAVAKRFTERSALNSMTALNLGSLRSCACSAK
jgi:hypothetical protein